MWLLELLPDDLLKSSIYIILIVGSISTFISLILINPLLKFFPGIAGFYRLIQIASVSVLLLGVYLFGGYTTEIEWRKKADKLEQQAKIAEAKMAEATAKLDKTIVERDFAIANRGRHTIERIEKYIKGETISITNETTKDLSPEQRAELEKQILELRSHLDKCPVPTLIVREHNLLIQEQNNNRILKGQEK